MDLSQTVPSPKTVPFSTESYTMPSGFLIGSDELRFDAGRYSPRFIDAISILRESGMRLERLGDITCNVFIPPRFKRLYVEPELGVPFLQGSHIVHFQPADLKYLSLSTPRLEQWIIRVGWLLVTRSGTTGRTTVCPEEWDGWAASEHILRIVPDEEKCGLHATEVQEELRRTGVRTPVSSRVPRGPLPSCGIKVPVT